MPKAKGFPENPVSAQKAAQLLAQLRALTAANDWKRAAPLSLELTRLAPNLTEAHDIMGQVAFQTTAFDIAEACFERAVSLGPVNAMRLHSWATSLIARGDFAAAVPTLERALVFRPRDPVISCDLADAYLAQNRQSDALKLFRAVTKNTPENTYAKHMVSALSDQHEADTGYVTRLFDSYAPIFDQHLTGALHYHLPQVVASAVSDHGPFEHVLDLGCGTGLVAEALKGQYQTIDGVDLSPRMIEKARERGLYRTLLAADGATALALNPDLRNTYDLVTAVDMLIYIGHPEVLFSEVSKRLTPSGIFAFTTESADTGEITVRPSGRFAHSAPYLTASLQTHGFSIVDRQSHPVRLEQQTPLLGDVYICRLS